MSNVIYLSKKSAGMIQADVEENCIEHGIRGQLKHSDIQKMVAHYTEDEKHARIHGKFHHLVGLIFKNFNRKIHVIKPFKITERDFIVLESLDSHPRNPDAVVWVGINEKDTKFVINELYDNYKLAELAEKVKKKAFDYRIVRRIADPLAFAEEQHQMNPSAHTLAARLYNDHDLKYVRATKNRTTADRRLHDALDYEIVGEDIILAPEIYFFDTCQRTIWEMEHYQWDDWRGKAAERKSPKEEPMKKDEHCIEALGRILVQEPVFFPMPPKNQQIVDRRPKLDPYA